jgi:hypothetical protein
MYCRSACWSIVTECQRSVRCFELFTSCLFTPNGQGQFLIVIEEELPAIKAAFKKFDTAKTPYRPQLTIVICVSCLYFCCL